MGSGSENEEERMTRKDISKKIGRNQYLTDCGVGREREINDKSHDFRVWVTRRMIKQGISELGQGVSLGGRQ